MSFDWPNAEAFKGFGAGLTAMAGVAYLWYRRVAGDRRSDAVESKVDARYNDLLASVKSAYEAMLEQSRQQTIAAETRLQESLSRHAEHVDQSTKTIEQLARERNAAVQEMGALRSEVVHLKETVQKLEREVHEMELSNEALMGKLEAATQMIQDLVRTQTTLLQKIPQVEEVAL
ncbi:hypothetical protein [Chitinolyticbacter meiyuanensis]|uniref:hypothetical protein n=1 Tax=Chitinolyticbacter meiyuanensis TaxID=682798 RepID=UPI0011E5C363|nr:hypothetical protein [Chitinolyticbacter meiyuanensis]